MVASSAGYNRSSKASRRLCNKGEHQISLWSASTLFKRHHKPILLSAKPKFVIPGTQDSFPSFQQLKNALSSASTHIEIHLI
ncbi:hypothetical protein RND81_09G261800 [Saponaria officinalis]|uniref:Uncharacterized protein n=1 Tax=Saponaria officinalis TaxID=3572 RepID=A0AAW1IS71_SAPOF